MEDWLRKLNSRGIMRFRQLLENMRAKGDARFEKDLFELRDNPEFHGLTLAARVEQRSFSNAFELAEYLHSKLAALPARDIEGESGYGEVGLWSWLSLWFFGEVCPIKPNGKRDVRGDDRYIPNTESEFFAHRYYRHLLAGPYRVYQQHESDARLLLCAPAHEQNGLYRKLADHQDLMQTRGIVRAVGLLYFDHEAQRPKVATGGDKPGALSRFVDVVRQLDLTYDLNGLSGEELLTILPDEFDAWKPS